jgi:signal transduction histidine kinase
LSVRRVRVRRNVIGNRRVGQELGDVGVTSTETRATWSDRVSPRNWSLAWKLVAVGLVPALLAIVLGVLRVADQAQTASELGAANQLLEVRAQVAATATALRAERDRATLFLAEKRLGDRGPLAEAVAGSDAAIDKLHAGLSGKANLDVGTRSALERADGGFAQLSVMRDGVTGSALLLPAQVRDRYTTVIDRIDGLDRAVLRQVRTPDVAGLTDALTAVSTASEALALQHTVLGVALRQGSLTPQDAATVNATDNAFVSALTDYQVALPSSVQPVNFVTSQANATRDAVKSAIVLAPTPGPIPVTPDQWDDAVRQSAADVDRAGGEVRAALTTAADTAESRSSNLAGINSVLLMLGLLLAATIIVLVARSLTRSLRVLRTSALDVAQRKLPQAVESMRSGNAPDVTVEPVPLYNRDEVGQVARAFDAVHGQALRLAADQAALQSNVSSMFVNLSRRSQGLVERQLQLIEQLESNEQDPDQLSNLFQLDHLATRMRRNSENLLVLAGTDFSKRNVAPVPLVDVLRAAVSEIEHYQRIVVQAPPQVTVVGRATSDIVHLLAELLDNATNFSPPESQVVMSSMRTPDGSILVEIADSGVGMLEQELTDANRRMTTPSAVDVSASRRMGLFVVGRLGARHGITVHLGGAPMGGPGGGLTASVTLPAHLVVAGDDAGRQPRGDNALVAAGSPNGVPPQRAGQLGRPAPRAMLAAPANGQQLPQPAGLNGLPTRTPGSSLRREPLVAQSTPGVADPATTEQPVTRGMNGTADRSGGARPNAWANGNDGDGRSRSGAPDAPAGDADSVPAGAEAPEQGVADVTPRNGTPADVPSDVFDSGHWDISQWDTGRSSGDADGEEIAAEAGLDVAESRTDVVEGAEAAATADTEADPAEHAAPGPDAADAAPAGRTASPRPRPSPGPNGSYRDKPLPSAPYRAADDGSSDHNGGLPHGAGRNGVDRSGGFAPPTTPLPVVPDDTETSHPSTAPAASALESTDPADALFSASVPAISELDGPPRTRRPLAELRRSPVDVTETTPIFAEIASAWFAEQRPVPVDWELGQRPGADPAAEQAPAAAPPGLSGPIGDLERSQAPFGQAPVAPAPADPASLAAPPARPGPARPAPSGAPQAPEPAGQAFATVADEGWRAASGAAAERPDELTAAGLPKRRPRARLVPGSAGSAVLAAPASPTRSAESIRGRLASYQQGVRQGRETRLRRDPGGTGPQPALPGENATAPAGGEHDEETR